MAAIAEAALAAARRNGATDADVEVSAAIGQSVTVSWTQNISISIPFWKSVTASKTIGAVFRCE